MMRPQPPTATRNTSVNLSSSRQATAVNSSHADELVAQVRFIFNPKLLVFSFLDYEL